MDNRVELLADPSQAIARCVQWLLQGGILGVPTESVYGLAVCADRADAVARLRTLKGREAHKPMPLVASDRQRVAELFHPAPPVLARLMDALWPGPLTLGLVPQQAWPEGIVSASGTAGVRVSAHPVLAALCRGTGGLITATSANYAGAAPTTCLDDLPPDLLAQALWLDAGTLAGGPPSTVLLPTSEGRLQVARDGAVTRAQLRAVVGNHVLC